MIQTSEHYKGREQASFKHKLLETYLERLFMIVGPTNRTICYVDCFAGPWQAKSEKLEDTSIAVSLNIIKKCREGLKKRALAVSFKALFIEKDAKAFEKLETFLEERRGDGTETKALHGEFFALRQEILNWCGNGSFAFFFIDPTGWKESVEPLKTLRPLLERPNSEFLINFMYDFLLRIHTQKMFEADAIEIFGEVPQTDHMTPTEKEAHLVNLYRKNLKNVVSPLDGKPRTAYVKVLKPLKDRTLYHLVYLTRHPKGITEFMEASEKLDIVQKINRATAKQEHRIEKSGQTEMFAAFEDIPDSRPQSDLSDVKAFWLERLSSSPRYFGVAEFADMLEETAWFMGDFQKAFDELAKAGKVRNLDDINGKRRTQFVHYENNRGNGERLVKTRS